MSIFSMFAVTGKRLLDLLDDQEVTPPPPKKVTSQSRTH